MGKKWKIGGKINKFVCGIDDTYSLVLKATEVRLMTAIPAENLCKSDTKQAFLYGDLEDDKPIYITPPDWWLDEFLEKYSRDFEIAGGHTRLALIPKGEKGGILRRG